MDLVKQMQIINNAYLYVPENCEGIRIDFVDNDECYFRGSGEETGNEYHIDFSDVDYKNDLFYRCELIPIDTVE